MEYWEQINLSKSSRDLKIWKKGKLFRGQRKKSVLTVNLKKNVSFVNIQYLCIFSLIFIWNLARELNRIK